MTILFHHIYILSFYASFIHVPSSFFLTDLLFDSVFIAKDLFDRKFALFVFFIFNTCIFQHIYPKISHVIKATYNVSKCKVRRAIKLTDALQITKGMEQKYRYHLNHSNWLQNRLWRQLIPERAFHELLEQLNALDCVDDFALQAHTEARCKINEAHLKIISKSRSQNW